MKLKGDPLIPGWRTASDDLRPKKQGVYFLANDRVYELVVAFLNSFRCFNPELDLCLIPFDENCDRIGMLGEKYGFSIFSQTGLLSECDKISRLFHGHSLGHYRKLAVWDGPFDEFIYIDVDTVVLSAMGWVFDAMGEYSFVTAYSDLASHRHFVWKEGVEKLNFLTADEIGYAANTGFIASRKGLLNLEYVQSKIEGSLRYKPYMDLSCFEQAFINFLIVTSELKYTSLLTLHRKPEGKQIALEAWAGSARTLRVIQDDGGFFLTERQSGQRLYRVLFAHWADSWRPTPLEMKVYSVLIRFGIVRGPHAVRRFLHWRSLWLRFRLFRDPRQHKHKRLTGFSGSAR